MQFFFILGDYYNIITHSAKKLFKKAMKDNNNYYSRSFLEIINLIISLVPGLRKHIIISGYK